MGFSLRHLLDDVIHPGQGNQQNNSAPAVTPKPGTQLNLKGGNQTPSLNLGGGNTQPKISFGKPGAPAFSVGNNAAPKGATTVYHDKMGNVTGWEDNQGSHLTPIGSQQNDAALQPPQPSLKDRLHSVLSGANNMVVKPVTNIVSGDIVEPSRSLVAGATHNQQAEAAADARAQADQADSLPQMIVRPFANIGKGLAYTPEAIDREIHNQPIDDIQQKVFGTTDSGSIARQIAGNTIAAGLTVAAPEITGASSAAADPFISELASPVAQKLATGGVQALAGAGTGSALNVASLYGSQPDVTADEVKNAAIQGGAFGGVFGGASGLLHAPGAAEVDPTAPKIIQLAQAAKAPDAVAEPAAPTVAAADPIDELLASGKKKLAALDKAGDENTRLMNELDGTQDVQNLDETPAEVANQKTAPPKKTGVSDPLIKQIEQARKSAINSVGDEIHATQSPNTLLTDIRKAGGISSSDHEGLPTSLKNKNGTSMDEMATQLGYKSDQDLMDAIEEAGNKGKPLTKTQARAQAEEQLMSGKHPMSDDFKEIDSALKNRQDELSQYPKGTRAQVKVNTKAPAGMDQSEFESLMNTPEGRASLASKKIPEIDPKKEIRNPDAERSVIEGLQKGTSNDAILEKYMNDTGTTLQKAVKDVSRVAKEANIETGLGKNPLLAKGAKDAPLDLPTVAEGDSKQAVLNARFVQTKEQELGSHALESYRKLSAHDQMLLKDIEQKTVSKVTASAENPKNFAQAEGDLRTYFDTRHAYDTKLGLDVGYRTNYIRHFFDKAEEPMTIDGEEINPTGDEQLQGGGANHRPGYTQKRTIEDTAKNVGDALERDIQGSSFNHAKLAYEKGLNEAFPGKISNGEIPRSANDGKYQQIQHPFGQDLSAPKAIARDINSRVWQPNDSKYLDAYDKVNRGLKYVKLSGGLFHAFTESGNFVGQQLASGKLFTDPAATARLAKVFFSDDAMKHEVSRMADNGTIDKAHLSGLTLRSKDILADANIKSLDKEDPSALSGAGEKAAKYTGVQAMHDATFQREIPYAKLKIFEQKTQGLDPSNPADLTKMRQQADSINNLFGGINREVQGIKPGTFRWLQRGLLATDFTEGKFATLGKALNLKDGSSAATTARQAVAGKALLFGLLATAGAAAGGDYKGKGAKQVATDAAGNLVDPSFEMGGYKVGLPKTHVSEVVDALKPSESNGKTWNASGLLSYAQNRTAALPSEAIQLLSNKNYYGQPLYGTNTKKNGGGKISPEQAALNVSQTVLPIPFGQATNTVTGKQAPAAAVANVIGFKAKPNADNSQTFDGTNVTLNDKQTETYQNSLKSNMKLTNQLTSSDSFKKLSPNDQAQALSTLKSNITSATKRQFASDNQLGQYAPDYTGKGSEATTKEQDVISGKINPDAYVPRSGNTDSAAVAAFTKSSAKSKQIGDKMYYKDGDGNTKNEDAFTYNNSQDSARLSYQLDRFKSNDNYSAWKAAASQKLDQLQKEANHYDPDTQADKLYALQKQASDLSDDIAKYDGYGGAFTKPKSGSTKTKSSNGIDYKVFSPVTYEKSLRSLLDAARIT